MKGQLTNHCLHYFTLNAALQLTLFISFQGSLLIARQRTMNNFIEHKANFQIVGRFWWWNCLVSNDPENIYIIELNQFFYILSILGKSGCVKDSFRTVIRCFYTVWCLEFVNQGTRTFVNSRFWFTNLNFTIANQLTLFSCKFLSDETSSAMPVNNN